MNEGEMKVTVWLFMVATFSIILFFLVAVYAPMTKAATVIELSVLIVAVFATLAGITVLLKPTLHRWFH